MVNRPAPWSGREVIVSFVVWIGLQFLLTDLSSRFIGGNPSLRMLNSVAATALALTIVLIPWLLKRTSGATLADLGFLGSRPTWIGLVQGLVASIVVIPTVLAIMALMSLIWPPLDHPIATMIRKDASPVTAAQVFLVATVLAPIAEEIVFRGVLMGWLTRKLTEHSNRTAGVPAPVVWANVLTSLLFAALHLGQWPAPIPLFILALFLGEARRRTANLAVPIAMHMVLNGVSTVFLLYQTMQAPAIGG